MILSVKWLGHASFEIKADGKVIYIDPYQGDYADKADIVLVSHSHFDHCDALKIAKVLKSDTLIIAPADCAEKIGAKLRSLKPKEKVFHKNILVEAVEAYNHKRFRSPGVPYHPKGLGVGYLIAMGNKTIYHAGDTDFIPEMEKLKNVYLALLPTGGIYTMDNQEAAQAVLTINPRYIVPMHHGDANPEEFRREVESKSQIKVLIPKPGDVFEI